MAFTDRPRTGFDVSETVARLLRRPRIGVMISQSNSANGSGPSGPGDSSKAFSAIRWATLVTPGAVVPMAL